MSSPRWYRSLYWRIALGLVAFLALMLAAEAGLFLWLTDKIAGSFPARSPRRLAVLVASDVGAALAANRNLDLEPYLHEQYGDALQTFVIIMDDGRTLSNHDDVPAALVEAVREEIEYLESLGARRFARRWGPNGPGPGPRPDPDAGDDQNGPRGGPPADAGPDGPRGGGPGPLGGGFRARRGREFAPIMVAGVPVGRVVVLPGGPPLPRLLHPPRP